MVSSTGLLGKLATFTVKAGHNPNADMGRFVVMGLPRSGTTYVMTLLNAHRDISCTGEQFNPGAVVGVSSQDDRPETLFGRDGDPEQFVDAIFEAAAKTRAIQGGFKFMLGHNITALQTLLQDPDLKIIHVWRENRLAQIASLIKATRSQRWAQRRKDDYIDEKIQAQPRQIVKRWHEFATTDFLAAHLLKTAPQQILTLEYKDLFQPGTSKALCAFLGVDHDPKMASPLVKQGSNRVLERFEKPWPIKNYFTRIGRADWLDEEL